MIPKGDVFLTSPVIAYVRRKKRPGTNRAAGADSSNRRGTVLARGDDKLRRGRGGAACRADWGTDGASVSVPFRGRWNDHSHAASRTSLPSELIPPTSLFDSRCGEHRPSCDAPVK